jgi:hypothetical protein
LSQLSIYAKWGRTLGLQFGALQPSHPLHFGFTISQQLLPNIGAILSFYQKIEHTTHKKVIVVKLQVFCLSSKLAHGSFFHA